MANCFPLRAVRLLEPVEVAALFDFGLTPRHLKNSGETSGNMRRITRNRAVVAGVR